MDVLVDSNVLIDILHRDPDWIRWSRAQVEFLGAGATLIINPIIYAEVSVAFPNRGSVEESLPALLYKREALPWEAAFAAGKAFLQYRRSGGAKRSPLPDFYIGAHAQTRNYRLLTRDPGRYRSYFPDLEIVAPDTHP